MLKACSLTAIVALVALVAVSSAGATTIQLGTPTQTVPSSLFDPLGSLTSPLPADEFLLPLEVVDAVGLQDWTFDLLFDPTVVILADGGGLYQSVYQAYFNGIDPTLSNITSSGLAFPAGTLAGIAGFSSGVSGDGLVAYVLYSFLPDQQNNEPNFSIANVTIAQTVPEPNGLALLLTAIVILLGVQRWRSNDQQVF